MEAGNMKKKIFALLVGIFTMIAVPSFADSLAWDHDGADGFVVYFTNQTDDYNYNVIGDVRECELGLLNLTPGVEYTIYVTAYNDVDESGPSNIVVYTRVVFSPPTNVLPVVSPPPGDPSGLRTL